MNLSAPSSFSILLPAFVAGLLVTATHVPLGTQVLARGIVFIDLAIAQIAGCGVLLADQLGFEPQGVAVQVAALAAALAGALLLTWTERVWPDVQEAVIGVMFVLGATGSVLLLASNVHGSEHLRDLLVGQILWVQPTPPRLGGASSTRRILALWFGARRAARPHRLLRAVRVAVTVSVQLVGLYLVFATLIVPPLATRRHERAAPRRRVGARRRGLRASASSSSTALDLPTRPGDRVGAVGARARLLRGHGGARRAVRCGLAAACSGAGVAAPTDSASVSRYRTPVGRPSAPRSGRTRRSARSRT